MDKLTQKTMKVVAKYESWQELRKKLIAYCYWMQIASIFSIFNGKKLNF